VCILGIVSFRRSWGRDQVVDDNVENCARCGEALGMNYRCAPRPYSGTAGWLVCAQGCAQRRGVTGVTEV
jgi:hypothetical protein